MKQFIEKSFDYINNLQFGRKIRLIALIFCLPLLILFFLLIAEQEIAIKLAKQQIAGLDISLSASRLLQNLHEYRGLTITFLAGDKTILKAIQSKAEEIDSNILAFSSLAEKYNETTLIKNIEKTKVGWDEIKNISTNIPLNLASNKEETLALLKAFLVDSSHILERIYKVYDQTADDYQDTLREHIDSLYTERIIAILLVTVTMGLSLMAYYYITESIRNRLDKVLKIAHAISIGDLTVAPEKVEGTNELSLLTQKLIDMNDNFRMIMTALNQSTDILLNSINKMMTSSSNLASSTQNTSAAIDEMIESVFELKKMTLSANDNTANILENAKKVSQISESGRALSNEALTDVKSMKDRADSILISMEYLSAQGQAIETIVLRVDEIAKQSTLLALNAMIEACHAKEYGKGFMVIAQEVQDLANKSRQFTKQVNKILTTVEEAIANALNSTTSGNEAIEISSKRSIDTSEYFNTLNQNIQDATKATSSIVTINEQQITGVDNVIEAMDYIKKSSNMNIENLAELKKVSSDIFEVSQKFKQFIVKYKL